MLAQTDADRFVLEQLQPVLTRDERVSACAYLAPVLRSGRVTAFVDAATQMAAFAALTNQRLLLVQTRIGAFHPLLENHGIAALDRAQIRGVFVGATVLLERTDGSILEYAHDPARTEVSTQRAFFADLAGFFGPSEAASQLAGKRKRLNVIGLALGIALAGLYVWHRFG